MAESEAAGGASVVRASADGHGPHDHHHHGRESAGHELGLAFWLTLSVLAVELAGARLSGSLALLADAGHVAADVMAVGLAAWAARLSLRPPTGSNTYGFGRAGILVALGNAALLLLVRAGITEAAVGRLLHPEAVRPTWMLAPAAFGLLVNLLLATRLHRHAADLNARSVWLHVAGDAGAAAGVIVAALLIAVTGWLWVDPLLSLLIAALVALGAWRVAAEAGGVLLEGSPGGLDAARVAAALAEVPGVHGVHHLHLWSIGGGQRALSGHIELGALTLAEGQAISRRVEDVARSRFGITRCTLQIEAAADCPDCDPQ